MNIFKGKYYRLERWGEPGRLVYVLSQARNKTYRSNYPVNKMVLLAIEHSETTWSILQRPDDIYHLEGNPYGLGDFKEVPPEDLPRFISWELGEQFPERLKRV